MSPGWSSAQNTATTSLHWTRKSYNAILAVLNELAGVQVAGADAWELARLAQIGSAANGMSTLTPRERLSDLTSRQEGLLEQIEALRQQEQREASQQNRLEEMQEKPQEYAKCFEAYEDAVVRKVKEKITVCLSPDAGAGLRHLWQAVLHGRR